MNNRWFFCGLAMIFVLLCSGVNISAQSRQNTQNYQNVTEAFNRWNRLSDGEYRFYADGIIAYFNLHKEEGVPFLINYINEDIKKNFGSGFSLLAEINDQRVNDFCLEVIKSEIDNNTQYYDDGRKLRNSSDSSGRAERAITTLGNRADARIIPLLEDTVNSPSDCLQLDAAKALCKVNAIEIEKLFDIVKSKRELVKEAQYDLFQIASHNNYVNPKFSIRLYKWIINNFSENTLFVVLSHYDLIQCYVNLKQYSEANSALQEFDKYYDYFENNAEVKRYRSRFVIGENGIGYTYSQFKEHLAKQLSGSK